MTKILAASLLLLSVSACGKADDGGGEDFALDIARPPAVAMAPFLSVDLTEARAAFAHIAVMTSRPADLTLRYTIPATGPGGSHDRPSVVQLTFEPIADGKATRIHAAVTVSDTQIIDKGAKVLDEDKVEQALHTAIAGIGSALARREPAAQGVGQLTILLSTLAVVSNFAALSEAQAMRDHPEAMDERLARLGLGGGWTGGKGTGDLFEHRMGEPDADPDARPSRSAERMPSGIEPKPAPDFGVPDLPDPNHDAP